MRRFFILLLLPFSVFSQEKDSLWVDSLSVIGNAVTTISSQDEQPLWLTSDKKGILTDNLNNAVLFADLNYKRRVGKNFKWETQITPVVRNAGFYDFEKGGSAFLAEYFSQFNYRKWYLRAGAKSKRIGQFGGDLSSGSLSQSQNARAVPMVSFGADYVDVPFTKGYLQVKGELSHGWLEKSRAVTNAWIHQKYAYFKLGHPTIVNLEFGVTHNAFWGGTAAGNTSEFSWNAYKSVFTGSAAGDSNILGGADWYVYGSHLGTLELAINFQINSIKGTAYLQRPWEDSQQIAIQQFFAVFFRRNKDGIFGLNLETENNLFKHINIEWVHTSHQMGPGLPDPPNGIDANKDDPDGCKFNQCEPYAMRENYYNNYIFNDGWSYYNRNLGTPLFTHQKRILNTLSDKDLGEIYGRNTIYNNRVNGFNIGFSGTFKEIEYKLKYTYTRNFGNYYAEFGSGYKYVDGKPVGWTRFNEPYYFKEGINQSYLLIEANKKLKGLPLEITGAIGTDFGGIYNSFGTMLGVKYSYVSARK